MATSTPQPGEIWRLAERQHGVVARSQLLECGLTKAAIKHRVDRGRLHPVRRGVYAVGRRQLPQEGLWMSAVLACGPRAVLSDSSAAALWGIREQPRTTVEITIPTAAHRSRRGIRLHRRILAREDVVARHGIPVTSPPQTLLHLAGRLDSRSLEAAVNQADKLDVIDIVTLRKSLGRFEGRAGVATLRALLDRHTFALTDSELERRFLPLARSAGLPPPLTGQRVNGFKVDFYWPELGLIVETDGLRYHRTPAQQARDRLRDQAHTAAGITNLRFTHAQVSYERRHVIAILAAVAKRLR